MILTQYYLDCLSQSSYLIGDETTGKAVIVDPRRDITEYLDDARRADLTVVGIIDTHFHADFVSGHLELARATGAWIGYGRAAEAEFDFRPLAHGERIELGEVQLQNLETPGHTPESISVLVYEHPQDVAPYGVLTGDALFVGDVGRPDLLASSGTTAEELAAQLYHSIHHVLMDLPDEVRVFPAHGAGSACGKNLSTERSSTIGEQRRTNYACRPMSEEEFVKVVTEGQTMAPRYFGHDAALNKQQHPVLDEEAPVAALTDEQIATAVDGGAVIHDARPAADHALAHVRGSISVPTDGRMAETAGMLLTPEQQLILMTEPGQERETTTRLARIGYDNMIGYIPDPVGYLRRHPDDLEEAHRLSVDEVDQVSSETQLLDLRNPAETESGMMPGAAHIPLAQLAGRLDELDRERPVVAYCAGGWRSSVGASFLRQQGFSDVSDVLGGYNAWAKEHIAAV